MFFVPGALVARWPCFDDAAQCIPRPAGHWLQLADEQRGTAAGDCGAAAAGSVLHQRDPWKKWFNWVFGNS